MERSYRSRVVLLVVAVALAVLVVGARLYQLQLLRADELRSQARRQHETRVQVGGHRGAIQDRKGLELAVSVETSSLYAHPHRFADDDARRRAAKELAPLLGVGRQRLFERLRDERPFIWLRRRLEPDLAAAIESAAAFQESRSAFGFEREPKRFYPQGALGVHVVGFSNIDQVGVEGIEQQFNELLQGDSATYLASRDGLGGRVLRLVRAPSKQPRDLVLTLDSAIQHIVERELDTAMRETRCGAASAIVLDPSSGEVLALANRPAADPNRYGESTPESRRNRAVVDFYEPGSTFKIVTASAALEVGRVRPEQFFDCERGSTRVAGHRIGDHHPFGVLSFREVIERSSNIGILKACRAVPPAKLYDHIRRFGFGERLGIELPGEREGLLRPVERWSALSPASIAFGQEIGVTVLQMAAAFAVLANDGVLVPPRVVLGARDDDGRLERFPPPRARRVIEARTARTLTRLLEGAVERGTGSRARMELYRIAGKTGTAQKAVPGRGYSPTDYVASFGGFGPLEDPRLVVMVVLDSPEGDIHQGGQVAAPLFRRILEASLLHLRVEPDRDVAPPRLSAGVAAALRLSRRSRPEPTRARFAAGQVPDVRGLSLRQAVSALADGGCRALARGSGLVVAQSPAPGTRPGRDALCAIRLETAGGGASGGTP